MAQFVGVVEAKRRFSELLDRVSTGERIVIARRGKPAVALVPPDDDLVQVPRAAPTRFAAIAVALDEFDQLDDVVRDIYSARRRASDRLAPTLDWRVYCLDTDVLSAVIKREPPLHLVRRLARTAPSDQCTTAITLGELLHGWLEEQAPRSPARVRDLIASAGLILPFDEAAAQR